MSERPSFTPRETVSELDRYIVGQAKAKRAVAVALRNRWRRQRVPDDLRDEIAPKNIIMIGPTGVGKTEIARRLAKLGQAPFLKVEASKFTEVGYVGRDVESMIRDLTEIGIRMVKEEEAERIEATARRAAEDRVIALIIDAQDGRTREPQKPKVPNFFAVAPEPEPQVPPVDPARAKALRKQLRKGELDNLDVSVEVRNTPAMPMFDMVGGQNLDEMMKNMKDALGSLGQQMGGKGATRQVKVPEALRLLTAEESEKRIDQERAVELALERVQHSGIIFLDEIDKIAGGGRGGTGRGPDVSRGGVQRDLLPIVEGSSVNTKHGVVKTDHILFIAAGAFHETQVSDLIPELQGRFPIRVELDSLTQADFLRILTEPRNSLVKQYQALLETERVSLVFTEDGLAEIARVAFEANTRLENIGARRLHTVLETVLEEISYRAPERRGETFTVDAELVRSQLGEVLADEDLGRYIL